MLDKYYALTPLLKDKVVRKLAVAGRPEGDGANGQEEEAAAIALVPSTVPGTC